jgi:hypothetical protein
MVPGTFKVPGTCDREKPMYQIRRKKWLSLIYAKI